MAKDVVYDGAEVNLEVNIDGGELGMFYATGDAGDYPSLTNKPKINGVVVLGEKLGKDYKLQDQMKEISFSEIDDVIFGGGL